MPIDKTRYRRRTVKPISEATATILRLLSQMPFASVAELAARRELSGMSRASVDARLDLLCKRDYVGCVVRGWRQRKKARFFLYGKGVNGARAGDGVPQNWSDTEQALRRLLRQGPMIELAYDVAPRLFGSNAVVDNWREGYPLSRFWWLSQGPVSAVAEYDPGLPGKDSGERLLVPYIWYGIRPKRNRLPVEPAHFLSGVRTDPTDYAEPPAQPCGVVILAADRLAGLRARLDLPPGIPRAIVTAKDRHGGSLIESMDPIGRVDRIIGVGTPPKNAGHPENIDEFAAQDAVLSTVMGSTDYLFLRTIEEWQGCNIRQLAGLCGHPESAIKGLVARFAAAGLVEWGDDSLLYPTEVVRSFAEERDRLARRKSRGRAGAERSPSGKRREHMRRHESGVIELALCFKTQMLFAGAGWRLTVNYPARTQMKPDLWVLIPLGDGRAMWHAVEYERSAISWKAIKRKLRPYLVAWDLGQAQPLLVVCHTEAAARRFEELGRDLPMLVGVCQDVLKRPYHGEESPWRRDGSRVDIDHLQRIPLWSRSHAERMQYLLVERTDLELERS